MSDKGSLESLTQLIQFCLGCHPRCIWVNFQPQVLATVDNEAAVAKHKIAHQSQGELLDTVSVVRHNIGRHHLVGVVEDQRTSHQ